MTEQGPESPDEQKPPETHETPLILFDEEEGEPEKPGPIAWIRGHPAPFVLVLAAITAWWAYLALQRSRIDAPEAAPVQVTEPESTPPDTVRRRGGVIALSDSMFSGPPGATATLTARALGSDGVPVENGVVRFLITEGAGRLSQDTVRTDAQGLAQTTLVLPALPGHLVVTATLADSQFPSARFSVTARAGTPRRARIVDGNQQKGPPGELLPQPLRVRVTDAAGVPVFDVEVRFHVIGQGGEVAPSFVHTDSMGYASALWRLGNAPGDQHVATLVPGIDDALLTFDATAVASEPDSLPAQEEPVPEAARVVPRRFAIGGSFVCALAGGRVSCRGGNDRGQRVQRPPTSFVAVTAGVSHACGLTRDGQAFCWGANDDGQLGDGSQTDRDQPVSVLTDTRFSELAAGVSYTCGLAADGGVFCWGKGLGVARSSEDHLTPVTVAGSQRLEELVAGWNHTCGLTEAKKAFCWGANNHGQLGNGTRVDRSTPTEISGMFESLVAGSAHTCGIWARAVLCWGDNTFGQLGDGSTEDRPNPTTVHGLPGPAVQLAAGAVSTCARLRDGKVYCWGQNVHGELGDGTRTNRTAPVAVAGGLTFRSIYAGGALTCGFATDGTQYCWGLNQSGQLGDGTRESRTVPTKVGG